MAALFSKNGIISATFAVINFLIFSVMIFTGYVAQYFRLLEKELVLIIIQVAFGVLFLSFFLGLIRGIIPDQHAVAHNVHKNFGIYFNFMGIALLLGMYLFIYKF
jgi:hypothetical protein